MRKIVIGLILLALASTSIKAADFDAVITSIDGSPIVDDKGKEVNLTVRTVSIESLMATYPDETGLTGEEKLRREELARRIFRKDTDGVTSEDITLIKKVVNKRYQSPLVVGQTWRALEKK